MQPLDGYFSGIACRTCHDRRRVRCGGFRLSFERDAGSCKARNRLRQSSPRLCRMRPDMAGDVDRVRIVVAAPRDAPHLRPALKGERNGGAAVGAEVNKDLLLADVRGVRIAAQRPGVEYHGMHGEHRLGVVRRPCHPLAKGAVASERPHGRVSGPEPNLSAEAATFEFFGHVITFQLMRRSLCEQFAVAIAICKPIGSGLELIHQYACFTIFDSTNPSCIVNGSYAVFQGRHLVFCWNARADPALYSRISSSSIRTH